ncbi:MAG: hypothetical protein M1826_007449 [Phylliscum demangeonii]|nr:MAG: hypothetical protein M1826_007449 [Phylliscum demangeonii]
MSGSAPADGATADHITTSALASAPGPAPVERSSIALAPAERRSTTTTDHHHPNNDDAAVVDDDDDDDAIELDDSSPRQSTTSSRWKRTSARILDANPPLGMWAATGEIAAKAPTIGDIRRGSFSHAGWTADGQLNRSLSRTASSTGASISGVSATGATPRATLPRTQTDATDTIVETADERGPSGAGGGGMGVAREAAGSGSGPGPGSSEAGLGAVQEAKHTVDTEKVIAGTFAHEAVTDAVRDSHDGGHRPGRHHAKPADEIIYPNGYKFPPKHTWPQASAIALKGFWRFFLTPSGFLITVYCLNVVAWGGMIFLLLLGAAPGMCGHPKRCNDINSPRRKWIEIDSQILTALFCVTGLGLIPWRFRDLYQLLRWRLAHRHDGLRRLAGIHAGWYRLPGSGRVPVAVTSEAELMAHQAALPLPLPTPATLAVPLTGYRALPTAPQWKLDLVVWMFVLNTVFQIVLCGVMWGMNRYDRPGWTTGLFVALACIVAAAGGLEIFLEGKRVKKIEGVPVSEEDRVLLQQVERGGK